jgi:hypothetical protein
VSFLAGDEASAKETVSSLIDELGFGPYDTGSVLRDGILQKLGNRIYNKPLTRNEAEVPFEARPSH